MTLRIASDDIEEIRGALLSAYGALVRELGESRGGPGGIQLCQRKWKLEALIRQLDAPEQPTAVLEMVPRRRLAILEQVAA